MMQGIVFVYEEKRSVKNRLLTVRIEDRKKKGRLWVPGGRQRVYTARDLQKPGMMILDKHLFAMAFKSETDFRKMEGRFFSMDEEYTLLRISPGDLKTFLARSAARGLLCQKDGKPVRFRYLAGIVPNITFEDTGNGWMASLSLEGEKIKAMGYEMVSDPVRIVSGACVYELVRGLPVTLVKKLMGRHPVPYDQYDGLLKELGRYGGKLCLSFPGRDRAIIRRSPVLPVLDFDLSLRFADLGFLYDQFSLVPMDDPRQVILNPQKNLELHRNASEEKKWQKCLEAYGAVFRGDSRGSWFIPQGKKQALLYGLNQDGVVLRLAGKPLVLDIRLQWEIKADNRRLCAGGAVQYQGKRTDMENILDAYLSGQPWFDLPGGCRGYMPKDLAQLFAHLELRGDFRDEEIWFAPYDFSFLSQALQDQPAVVLDQPFKRYLALLEEKGVPERPGVPPSLRAELRPYQTAGFRWLARLHELGFSGILADDMGLGKTLQVLAFLLYLKEHQPLVALVVVPKTLIWNWASEARRFAPDLEIQTYAGTDRDKAVSGLAAADLVITSYGLVRQDREVLTRISWDLVILDEAQAIKNPASQIARSVKALGAKTRLCLTGTPIENHPLDLWSQFDFLMPGFLGNRTAFQEAFATQDPKALDRLGTLIAPFVLRRMKRQVCRELPPKTDIIRYCGFSEAQKACYDTILKTGKQGLATRLESAAGTSRSMQILTLLLRLRQAACHPALVAGEKGLADALTQGPSGKLEAMMETAMEILSGGHKILIFSQFVALLELVKQMFQARGIEQHTLYGTTGQRKKVIRGFKTSPGPCVFLISLKTGGVGLNLTEAGYVFLLDPWWNPAVENQALDRAYRIGQENPVTVYRFITQNSVEEKVDRLKQKKRQMAHAVLGHGQAKDLLFTEKELMSLVG